MANDCIPYYEPGERITGHASATVTGKRFLKISGNIQSGPGLNTATAGGNVQVAPADAGSRAFGVAAYDAASGDKVSVVCAPGTVVPVVADGSIAAFAEVEVGATGKAKTKSLGGQAVGLCLTAVTDGNDAMIQLLGGGSAAGEPGTGNEYAQGTAQAAIADTVAITGGESPTEAEFNGLQTKVNSILAVLREYGMIAP